MPADLADTLDRDPDARGPRRCLLQGKQRLVLAVEQAKTAETRGRRVARAVEELRAGRDR